VCTRQKWRIGNYSFQDSVLVSYDAAWRVMGTGCSEGTYWLDCGRYMHAEPQTNRHRTVLLSHNRITLRILKMFGIYNVPYYHYSRLHRLLELVFDFLHASWTLCC
jgi:hypothetical protein